VKVKYHELRIFPIVGTIILLVGMILLLVGSIVYWEWLKCESTPCGLPVESFDYHYLITGLIISPIGVITLVIGLKKRI